MGNDTDAQGTLFTESPSSAQENVAEAVSLSRGESCDRGSASLRFLLATVILIVTSTGLPAILFGQTTIQQSPNPLLQPPKTTIPSVIPNPLANPPAPAPPRLVDPREPFSVTTQSRGAVPPAAIFRWQWQPTPSLFAPTSFTLCLRETGQSCSDQSATLIRNIPLTVFEHRMAGLPRIFEGKQFHWSVGICTVGGDCNFSIGRRFMWNAPPATPPDLKGHVPVAGDQLLGFRLAWNHPGGAGITYRICFKQPGTICPSGNSVVIDTQQRKTHDITPQDMIARGYDRFAGAPETHWTAAACNGAGCTWASASYGVLRIPSKPAIPVIRPSSPDPIRMFIDPTYVDMYSKPLEPPLWKSTPSTQPFGSYGTGLRKSGTCLIFEGSPLEPGETRTATTDLCETLADIMPLGGRTYDVLVGGGQECTLIGYLKHGYYRAFAQTCYSFWGCGWNESGQRFLVDLTLESNAIDYPLYDRIDLKGCFRPNGKY